MLFPPAPSAHLFAPFDVLKSGGTIRAPPPAAVGPFLLSQTQPSINFYVVAAHPHRPSAIDPHTYCGRPLYLGAIIAFVCVMLFVFHLTPQISRRRYKNP
jgi:hypothetical protein